MINTTRESADLQLAKDDGDLASLDLPQETWDGLPSSDKILIENRWTPSSNETYVLLNMMERESTSRFDVSYVARMTNLSTEQDLDENWAEFFQILQNGDTPVTGSTFSSVNHPPQSIEEVLRENDFTCPVVATEPKISRNGDQRRNFGSSLQFRMANKSETQAQYSSEADL